MQRDSFLYQSLCSILEFQKAKTSISSLGRCCLCFRNVVLRPILRRKSHELFHWVSLPYISPDCNHRFVPVPQGISLLLTTPPILYLVKSFRWSFWAVSAWVAFLLQVALLSTHTGYSWEFGYRFLMDFIIPVVALIAVVAGKHVSWI